MQNAQLTLLLPEINIASFKSLKLPGLTTLINRSDSQDLATFTWEAMLCQLFGINPSNELPIAALTGLADGLSTQSGYWLRADPVQLQADLSAVYLVGNTLLNLTTAETESFQQELNQFFKQDQLQLFTPAADRWYLQVNNAPQITTHSLNNTLGKNILEFMPQGAEHAYWRKLLTELQMLLYVSPGNQRRAQKGLPVVNGLWFWGAGQLPIINKMPWQTIWTEDILLRGLAQAANIPLASPPPQVQTILQQMTGSQQHLVSLTSDLQAAEDNWFKPLMTALRKKQLSSLALYLDNKLFYVSSKTIRYFWRRKS